MKIIYSTNEALKGRNAANQSPSRSMSGKEDGNFPYVGFENESCQESFSKLVSNSGFMFMQSISGRMTVNRFNLQAKYKFPAVD